MGYYTDYTVEVENGDPFDRVLDAIKEKSFYSSWVGNALEGEKWYSQSDDVKAVSEVYPDKLIVVSGEGEESGDIWREYFLNGKSQYVKAKLTFEDFDKNKLK
tara:strand:+ start:355 stop:663 length:309 start_codon:yes stop_codon:yes gene_type:complete